MIVLVLPLLLLVIVMMMMNVDLIYMPSCQPSFLLECSHHQDHHVSSRCQPTVLLSSMQQYISTIVSAIISTVVTTSTSTFIIINRLLGHLVGSKYTMNPAASHQSQEKGFMRSLVVIFVRY